jgi:hypothetical protein
MPPSEKLKKVAWLKSGAQCAMCREILCIQGASAGLSHFIGDVAHIVAEEKDGPRGISPLTLEQRNSELNLVLLCKPHHKQIDDDPATYTVDILTQTKLSHENWVKSSLSISTVWDTKLFQLHYLNVPRLSLLSSLQGIDLAPYQLGGNTALHQLGWELNVILSSFERVLQTLQLKAVPLDLAVKEQDPQGMIVSFNHTFRTKNISMPQPGQSFDTFFTGDLKRDAHLYSKLSGRKVIANIDRRWITTTTAFGEFRPSSGRNNFAGLGFINSFDRQAKTMSMTPYVIGIPSNPVIEAFYGDGA